jgi:hypothetical protein
LVLFNAKSNSAAPIATSKRILMSIGSLGPTSSSP